jgi:thiosulfate/3-mercaptopyruvate sulfurtransferase
MNNEAHMLMTPSFVLKRLIEQDNHIVIVDCRHDLMDHEAGRKGFEASHIRGAHFASVEHQLSGARTGTNGRHPLPRVEDMRALLQAWGVRPQSLLAVYDASGGAYALRLWWLARWAGHANVSLIDGGFPAWTAASLPVEAGPTAPLTIAPHGHVPDNQAQSMPTVGAADVEHNLSVLAATVVDARAANRYRGEVEPIDPVAGHIPHALNRPFSENLHTDGTYKSASTLHDEFTKLLGGTPAQQVIHQCGSGVTACHNLFAMELAGLHGSKLYPGSWSEWVSKPTRPVARG